MHGGGAVNVVVRGWMSAAIGGGVDVETGSREVVVEAIVSEDWRRGMSMIEMWGSGGYTRLLRRWSSAS